MKVLFMGDVFGQGGRKAVRDKLPELNEKYCPDFIIVNGENSAQGRGITHQIVQEFNRMGVDAITMGNHTWSQKEFIEVCDEHKNVLVPANMPSELPGVRKLILEKNGMKLCVINLLGRVGLDGSNCPFECLDRMLPEIKKECKTVLVDFHAEATAEKLALAWENDGRVAALIGTHTHVQTNDARILDFGTGYITDAGMCGPYDGIIGSDRKAAIEKLKYHYPAYLTPAKGRMQVNGIFLDIDEQKGKTVGIEIINIVD